MADDKKMVVLEKRSSTPGISPEVSDHGTKTDFLKSPAKGKIPSFPGDFELLTLTNSRWCRVNGKCSYYW